MADYVKLLDRGQEGHRAEAQIQSLRPAIAQEVVLWNNLDHPYVTKVFRSIDSNSVKGFPKDPKEATGKKTVIVDADAGNYRRQIRAFVGGLDLCGGRYDIPSHPLFSTLQTLYKDDYHQTNYTENLVIPLDMSPITATVQGSCTPNFSAELETELGNMRLAIIDMHLKHESSSSIL
ncbi:phospholipase D gamma 1 [Artemisia annua]|uniref:Phospholipase D gamma 1 n=1 Tax=Artemisia annua TaxID=35608 RepID=A0A2U1N9M5_ARTAN|nr:phospholipase D gamma 1 [Artemisia annua]